MKQTILTRFKEKFKATKPGLGGIKHFWKLDANGTFVSPDKVEAFLESELEAYEQEIREKTLLEASQLAGQQMTKYANTPLKDRKNAFDELYLFREALDELRTPQKGNDGK